MARLNLDQLSKKILFDKDAAKKSQAWFAEQTKYLTNQVSPNSLMMNADRLKTRFIPGQMYMYYYHPKGAAELPYYDSLPLIFPFSTDEETFTGINFHYLPVKVRVVLLKNLLDFATSTKLDEKTRLKLQWDYIGGISRYRGVNLAVKKYRYDHVQSQFLFIPANQWFNAVMLPMERFNTGSNMVYFDKNIVWRESMRFL